MCRSCSSPCLRLSRSGRCGKDVPNQVVGIAAPLAGASFLYLFSDNMSAVVFGVALIAVGGIAWYRVWRGETGEDPAAPTE